LSFPCAELSVLVSSVVKTDDLHRESELFDRTLHPVILLDGIHYSVKRDRSNNMRKRRICLLWVGAVVAILFCPVNRAKAQALSPTSLSFGNLVINTSASRSITLTNNRKGSLTISGISASGEFTESSNCPTVLFAGARCTIEVAFAPATLGPLTGTLTVNDDASSSPQTAALNGIGVPSVAVLPNSLVLGDQLVDTATPAEVVTLENYQTVPLEISGISTSRDFSQNSDCPLAPSTLAAKSSCTINVAFAPHSAGALTGTVTVSDNAPVSPQVQLSGTGVASQLGSISDVNIATCPPGSVPGVCYGLTVSCPAVADVHANFELSQASNPIGTMVLTSGGNGTSLWEADVYGPYAIDNLLNAGYSVVQIVWLPPYGWQVGPGGMVAVACRPATLINWIYNNIHQNGASAPMCAAGTSSGAEQIGLGMARYGLSSILAMAELISGPPFSREDYACECNQPDLPDPCNNSTLPQCLGAGDAIRFVDPVYSSPICSQATKSQSTKNQAAFLLDSILSPDARLNYPDTYVHFVFGGLDTSLSPVMGQEYQQAITSRTGLACVASAPHELLSVLAGAQQVSNDLISGCHLHGSKTK
jgi:hypothetical protein